MPTGLGEALKLLGFGTPFIYAAATYGFFHFLDKRASGPAKKAVSGWIASPAYDKSALADALVEMFDRLYTRPLLGWRALLRSTAFTLLVTAACAYELFWWLVVMIVSQTAPTADSASPMEEMLRLMQTMILQQHRTLVIVSIMTTILSDYVSLFVIRRWLVLGRKGPLLSLIMGPVIGACVIVAVVVIRDTLWVIYITGDIRYLPIWWTTWYDYATLLEAPLAVPAVVLVLPAFAVHLWLPLFGLAVVGARALNAILFAVRKTQWFLKQGHHHPLEAIGHVAAGLVFIGTAAVQWIVR